MTKKDVIKLCLESYRQALIDTIGLIQKTVDSYEELLKKMNEEDNELQ